MKEIKSPCINLCKMKKDTCLGCKRTLDEIKYWVMLSDEEKQIVYDRIKEEKEYYPFP